MLWQKIVNIKLVYTTTLVFGWWFYMESHSAADEAGACDDILLIQMLRPDCIYRLS